MGDRINTNDILYPGNDRWSNSGQYQFVFQEDSNLVLYKKNDDGMEVLWASNTYTEEGSTNHSVLMQADGNLVMYNADGQPIWASGTGGIGAPYILVQDDGNVCMYDDQQEGCFWNTETYQG